MATIVNERDKLLQTAVQRLVEVELPTNIIPEGVKSILLTPTTGVFKTDNLGVTTPSSIVFSITRKYLSAAATWSVIEGTATLTGTGDSRTVTYGTMGSDKITIQAQVVESSKTYTAVASAVKIKDGTNGSNGANGSNGIDGRRGTVDLYVLGSSWSDSTANSAILSQTGSSLKYAGDKVTIYNNAGFAETKYWDGLSAWVTGQIINGNLLVTGTITSDKIGTNELSAVNIKTSGYVSARGGDVAYTEQPNLRAPLYGYNDLSNNDAIARYAVVGYGNACAAIAGISNSTLTYDDVVLGAPKNAGLIGIGGTGGYFRNFNINVGTALKAFGNGMNTTAIRAQADSANSWAIDMSGRLRWNSIGWDIPPNDSTKFLCSNGTWVAPSASGGVTSFNTRTGAVTLSYSDVNTAVSGNTLSINITGYAPTSGTASSASNASALGGYSPSSYLRITGTAGSAGSLAGYLIVTDGSSSYKIPAYNL